MFNKKTLFSFVCAAALMPVTHSVAATTDNPMPGYADGAPVVLSGTINEVREDEFDLNYGSGAITVELDGWDWTGQETNYLRVGEKVTVAGRIDDDLFEGREVEADNIYLQNDYVYYYTNDSYPSYRMYYESQQADDDGRYVSMRGTVKEIGDEEFILTALDGGSEMKVDASEMDYNPFDDEGMQRITPGSTVHVYGELDDDFFERREIEADSIVVLSQAGGVTVNP